MATLEDLFLQEGSQFMKSNSTLRLHAATGDVEVRESTCMAFLPGSYYRAFLITDCPSANTEQVFVSLLEAPKSHTNLHVLDGHVAGYGTVSSAALTESPNVVFYIERRLTDDEVTSIGDAVAAQGRNAIIRDLRFAEYISEHERPLAFISHDSRDKPEYARPLAEALARALIPVWFDEYSLGIGDSLYESIEQGLKNAPNVIILLSKNFISNERWGRAEFVMAAQRQVLEAGGVLLPVWIDMTAEEVREYDLTLAGLVAADWSEGLGRVVQKLVRTIKKRQSARQPPDSE